MEHRLLTFIIPIRHQENAVDWALQTENLLRTANSIANQTHDKWRAVVVANEGAALPALPKNFEVVRVDTAPNPLYDLDKNNFEDAMQAVRLDKGHKIAEGIKAFPRTDYFMLMDDDDFVSNKLVDYISKDRNSNGYYINKGYAIDYNGSYMFSLDQFHKTCGSSHIFRQGILSIPDVSDLDYSNFVRKWLGSHGATTEHFSSISKPLKPFPFHAAVYLLNNKNSHSGTNLLWRQYIFNKSLIKTPSSIFSRLKKLKRLKYKHSQEFGILFD